MTVQRRVLVQCPGLVLKHAHAHQAYDQQNCAQHDRLELRNRTGRTANKILWDQGRKIRERRYQTRQWLKGDKPTDDRGNRKRKSAQPRSPIESVDNASAEPIVRQWRRLKQRLQQSVFCVFDFFSHVDDL